MWLFDDILKKPEHTGIPTDPLSGMADTPSNTANFGWTGIQPPRDGSPIIIEKSSEETVFGAETETRAIEAMNSADTAPVNQADSDTSSILMSASPSPMTDSPVIITPEVPASGVPATVEVTPTVIESAPAPVAAFEMTPTPTVDFSPAPTPMIETPVQGLPASASIFDSIMAESTPVSAPAAIPESVVAAPSTLSNLWDEPVAAPLPVASVAPIISQPAPREIDATHNFTTPREFLEKSISNIDVMLGNIDARHTAKETEELGYKMEKLRFTELEKTAHTEKIIMDKERDHANSMRKMLEREIEKDEANKKEVTSVEASMNDIGNKHPVHKAHKTEHVKE